jgi:hypothetical protein
MATHPPKGQAPEPTESVLQWLLDSDPSIRWQVMQDLTRAPAEEVAAERARVATEGWGAQLLARQEANGRWGGDPDNPEWTCLLSLLWLRDLGLDPSSTEARRAVARVRDNVTWHWWYNKPFFEGEVEARTSGRMFGTSWTGCSVNKWTTAAGTASRKTARPAGHSTPRSACSRGSWGTSRPQAARQQRGRPASEGKSTSLSAVCFTVSRPAN